VQLHLHGRLRRAGSLLPGPLVRGDGLPAREAVPAAGHGTWFEFSAEIFNATKALNFPNTINRGTSANTFRMTSTQSAARTAQLVWRVSW
jgi:hypothetical protein